jgi:hypothetical protein
MEVDPRERVLWALACPECGGQLVFRDDLLECVEGHRFAHVESLQMRNGSDLVDLRDARTSRPLFLKIPRLAHWNDWNEERVARRVRHELDTATRLTESLGAGPYRVPDMVPGPVRGRALLMRRLDGVSLERWLYGREAWLRPRRVLRGCGRSGAWLGAMAAGTGLGTAEFDPASTLEAAEGFLLDIADRGHPPDKVRWLRGLVEASAEGTAGRELTRCIVHVDFRPRHVLLDDATATVIDWEDAREGWAHEDAAFFLASLDGFLAQHPRRRWSPAALLAPRAFLRAYLRSGPAGWEAVGPLFRVAAMVRALHIDYDGRLARRRPWAFRHIVLPHYDRWFRDWERRGHRGAGG